MNREKTRFLIALSLLSPHLSPRRFNQLLSQFSIEEFFEASSRVLELLQSPLARELLKNPPWKEVDDIQSWSEQSGTKLLWQDDPLYPQRLKILADPPPSIYWQGDLSDLSALSIAVVGTRKPTMYGREATRRLTMEMAENGVLIVSGLARGLDSDAHRAALSVQGKTIAVLGSGLRRIYPSENLSLARKIRENGALISEYPPEASAESWHFPARNRLIAALSQGVLVVEAGEKSGSLITVNFALELGAEVFAVPGSIFSKESLGCLRLLKEGAKLVTSGEDILEEFGLQVIQKPTEAVNLTVEEERFLQIFSKCPRPFEEILAESGLQATTAFSLTSMLEVKGLIRVLPGKYFVRN